MASLRHQASPAQRQLLKGKIQIARVLSISSRDFARMIDELEDSDLFKKLFSSREHKVIHRKSFSHATLSKEFYELTENLAAAPAGDPVEKLLDSKKDLIGLIRRIGRENFEKYFLHDNGEFTREDICAGCGINASEMESVNALVNKVFLESEVLHPSMIPPTPSVSYSNVAQIVLDKGGDFSIAFFSPHMTQGTYQVDYPKLQKLKKQAVLTPEEKRNLNALLSKISLINTRKNSLYHLILKVIEYQKRFFSGERMENLAPLTQRRIAFEIRISPSSISRLIYARSIEGPSGREYPLESFFLSRKSWLKERLRDIFRQDQRLTDERVKNIIRKQYGMTLSRRSVNQYRKETRQKPR